MTKTGCLLCAMWSLYGSLLARWRFLQLREAKCGRQMDLGMHALLFLTSRRELNLLFHSTTVHHLLEQLCKM